MPGLGFETPEVKLFNLWMRGSAKLDLASMANPVAEVLIAMHEEYIGALPQNP
jgi:hypothetical protein